LFPPETYYSYIVNENDKDDLHEVILARVTKEMNEPRMTASVRETLGTPAAATRPFRLDEGVYNRNTKEYGVVRRIYLKDGIVMYKVWLPATPNTLRWGHFVSDWAEGVLEPSDKAAPEPTPLATGV
jgi:hypothetical protein